MNAQRHCLALDLKDDPALIAQYEALHRQIWPQISQHLLAHGVLDMQIWRLGTRLFMVMDTAPDSMPTRLPARRPVTLTCRHGRR